MKIGALGLCLLAALALLAGCGEAKSETNGEQKVSTTAEDPGFPCTPASKQLNVTLDGRVGAANAGFVIARELGFFADAGLHVWMGAPANPELPVSYVGQGYDFGLAQEPQVAIARDMGYEIVAVGSVIPSPTAAMIWLKGAGIDKISDLEGKTIAIPGVRFQRRFLKEVLESGGLTLDDVRVMQTDYDSLPALLQGKADAIFGGSREIEGVALESRGAEPVVTPIQKFGVPDYEELVVIARPRCLHKYPGVARAFLAAVAHGYEAVAKDPERAGRMIAGSVESDPGSSPKEATAQVKAMAPLLSRTGRMDPERASNLLGWMHGRGLIGEERAVSDLLTNEYWPR
jgi:putative hydroxymethylpyrimidine transport system substrate-binding protein